MLRPATPKAFALHGGQAEQAAANGGAALQAGPGTVRRSGIKRKFGTRWRVSLQRRLPQEMMDERAMILD
jgi:hypothetical protein